MAGFVSWVRCAAAALPGVALLWTGSAQVTIEGLANQTVYTDSVAFTVTASAGFDCRAFLGITAVPLGEPVVVESPDYHELLVFATNQVSGEVSHRKIQFIVRASERGSSEWGLPPWTPHPLIASTAAELAGAELEMILPSVFPAGLDVPVAFWLTRADGTVVRANATITTPGQSSIVLRRGVGSGFLSAPNAEGSLEFVAQLPGVTASKSILIEPDPEWTTVAGELTGTVDWPANSRIAIAGPLTVAADSTLRVGSGSVVRLDAGVDLVIDGRLVAEGTTDEPIVFMPSRRNEPWGGFILRGVGARLEATGTIFTGSGADAGWFDANPGYDVHRREQALFLIDGAELTLTNCFAIDHQGQFGHGKNGLITLDRCLVQRFVTGGEYNGGAVGIYRSALIEFPEDSDTFADEDNDAIYFTTGTHELHDTLIGWAKDDGIDHGSGGAGSILVSNCWVESCYHEAFAWSGGGRIVHMTNAVCLNSGQGIEAGWSNGTDSPLVYVGHSLSIGNLSGARFGDNYDWTYEGRLEVGNSLLLFNHRDVFGYTWSDWTYREAQMDVRGNWLTTANPRHPDNQVWQPARDGWRLAAFMTTPPDAPVGVGIALRATQLSLDLLSRGVPIGLSSFTTHPVTVHYVVEAAGHSLISGSLEFMPGETVKLAPVESAALVGEELVRFRITGAEGGEITGQSVVWYLGETVAERVTLVPAGSAWHYLDDGSNQGEAWTGLEFDHSTWGYGQAELGYGDARDGRPETTLLSYGPDSGAKHITYYFRHIFTVDDRDPFAALRIQLKRDDGAVVYLNGETLFKSNLDADPVTYLSRARLADDDGALFHPARVGTSHLRSGVNVLAVEIHQESPTSSDVSFDLSLEGERLPKLQLLRFGSEPFLFWSAAGFILETADRLGAGWRTLELTSPGAISIGTEQQFYRLRAMNSP